MDRYLIATLLALTLAEMYAFLPRPEEISCSDFKASLRKGRVSDLTLDRQTITGTFAREGREGGPVAS